MVFLVTGGFSPPRDGHYLGEAELSIEDGMLHVFQLRHTIIQLCVLRGTKQSIGEAAMWLSDTNNKPLWTPSTFSYRKIPIEPSRQLWCKAISRNRRHVFPHANASLCDVESGRALPTCDVATDRCNHLQPHSPRYTVLVSSICWKSVKAQGIARLCCEAVEPVHGLLLGRPEVANASLRQ
jgi:hypothetical protein